MEIQPITVPYRYDEPDQGVGRGPAALLAAGIGERLAALGLTVREPLESRLDPAAREQGQTEVNIGRLAASTAGLVASARNEGHGALVLAGDDTGAVGVVAGLQAANGADAAVGVIWLDAHGDFNTPETTVSGILAGMPLAIIAGLGDPHWRNAAGLVKPVPANRILLAGVRELDEKEHELLRSTSIHVIHATQLRDREAFDRAIRRLLETCTSVLLHIDLDVLDPYLVPSSSTPAANGLGIAEAAAAMATVLQTGKVAAVCASNLNPGGGLRGETSVKSSIAVLEQALVHWREIPPLPALP